jgi:tetratricopeptide (TPR) repeat protein
MRKFIVACKIKPPSMRKGIFLLSFILLGHLSFSENKDSLQIINLKGQVQELENNVKEIRRDELNYKIEKDLLKETYSNNYERISLIITIVLGIIGLFGYLGLKDINSVKKEYTTELSRLSKLKTDLEGKIKQISETQVKYEKDILEIIKQNEEQNKKIKLLELNGKIKNLRAEKKFAAALEACLVALQIAPDDTSILLQKGLIYSITRSYSEAIQTYIRILQLNPTDNNAILNLPEVYILNNQNESSDEHIERYKPHFDSRDGNQAKKLFAVLKAFNSKNNNQVITEIKGQIDNSDLLNKEVRFDSWGLNESLDYIEHSEDSIIKTNVKLYYDYLLGKINGKELLEKLVGN